MLFHKQERLTFRKWIDLENHKKLIAEAVEGSEFPDRVFGYLSTAFGKKHDKGFWKTPVSSFMEGVQKFVPDSSIPILNPPKGGKTSDWEYKGRNWFYYSHLLAAAYGWSLEYISSLDVNEAIAHVQEVLTDEFLEQEFHHSLSEISYEYNKTTKKSYYKPLPKPYWMRPVSKPIKKIRIKRDMLPIGYVLDVSGLGDELGDLNQITQKNEAQETEPARDSQSVSPPS